MTNEIKTLETKLQFITNSRKFDRIELFLEWLQANNIEWRSSNSNIHIQLIQFKYTEVNIWPTTRKMCVVKDTKRTTYVGWETILPFLRTIYD